MENTILVDLLLKYGKSKIKKPGKVNPKKAKPVLASDYWANPLRQNYRNDLLTRANKTAYQWSDEEVISTIMTFLKKHKISLDGYTFFNTSYYNNYNDLPHNQRVLLYISYIAIMENVSVSNFIILINAAKLHDIGRINNIADPLHGHRSAEYIQKYQLINLDNDQLKMLLSVVDAHSAYDKNIEGVLYKYDIALKDYDELKKLCYILKDAEALDKVRFLEAPKIEPQKLVNINLLKTHSAKNLIAFAINLVEYYKKGRI